MRKMLSILMCGIMLFTLIQTTVWAAEAKWLWPVPASTSTSRGYTSSHTGVDITAAAGTPIVASKSGSVIRSYQGCKNYNAYSTGVSCRSTGCSPNAGYWENLCNAGYGNGIVIDHGDGTFSHYAHMSSVAVQWGTKVAQGQVIGYIGSTGASSGPHCHFALAYSDDGSSARFNNNKDVIGYIYNVESAKPSVVLDPSSSRNYVGETNAVVCANILNPAGGTISTAGAYLYDAGGNRILTHKEQCHPNYVNKTSVPMYIDFNSDAKYTLKKGTTYFYELYAYVDNTVYVSQRASFTTQGKAFGDVDQNGKVDAVDALQILKVLVGKQTLSTNQFQLADVDASTTLSANDALLILKYLVGRITVFPVET